MAKRKYTDEQVMEWYKHYQKGYSLKESAKHFNVPRSSVITCFRRLNLKLRSMSMGRIKYNNDDIMEWYKYYQENHSLNETSAHFNIDTKTLTTCFNRLYLKTRSLKEGVKLSYTKRSRGVDRVGRLSKSTRAGVIKDWKETNMSRDELMEKWNIKMRYTLNQVINGIPRDNRVSFNNQSKYWLEYAKELAPLLPISMHDKGNWRWDQMPTPMKGEFEEKIELARRAAPDNKELRDVVYTGGCDEGQSSCGFGYTVEYKPIKSKQDTIMISYKPDIKNYAMYNSSLVIDTKVTPETHVDNYLSLKQLFKKAVNSDEPACIIGDEKDKLLLQELAGILVKLGYFKHIDIME